jgi:selenium donor protein
VGRETTEKEVQLATEKIVRTVKELDNQKQSVRIADDRSDIKLTQFTHGLGCACKLQPQTLEKIINKISNITDKNVLAGIMDSEDAAIYKINENTAFISTIDFFTPIVDDPYDFGRIAAANALSDIYAMGGTPLFALNIAAFPENRLPLEVLEEIIAGARRVAEEAGISILGGHTIEDNEPKFGLVANGIINPKKILKNKDAQKGDVIILTKPLGLGIHSTALKRNLLNNQEQNNIIRIMTTLNKEAAGVVAKFPVNSCTDVTGFGLLGHLNEILTASQVQAELYSDKIPVIKGTRKLVRQQVVPGGTKANLKYIQNKVEWNSTPDSLKLILADAQTSGGLLFTLPEKPGNKIIKELKAAGIEDSAIIGRIITDSHKRIKIL